MQAGTLISDKYRLLRKIGEGGMGSVWVARNEVTDREFAIKFMSAELAQSEALTARFLQEARVAGRLRHPSLLEIFDAGVARELEGTPYLVMELLDGISLEDAIRKAGRLPPGVALELMSTVARAMAVVHEKGIVHRDLKPANVFMHRPGTGAIVPKVLDFGISKVTGSDTNLQPSKLTQTGSVLGSPLYMSPEQASGDKTIDARSDIHALGVVLWECLVGSPPFSGDNYNMLVVDIMVGPRPRLEDRIPGASRSLCDVVARAFAIKRDDRFPSAAEFADAIDAEIEGMGHTRVLDSRDGAAFFFALLSGEASPQDAPGSSTTSGHAVLARSANESQGALPHAESSADGPHSPGAPETTSPIAPKSTTGKPRSRWLLPLLIGATSVLVVGTVGVVWRVSQSPDQAAASAVDPHPMAPAEPVSEVVSTAAPSLPPIDHPTSPAASSAPALSSSTPPSLSVAPPRSTPATGSTTTPPRNTSTAKTAKPPAHHGVEDDGL